MEWEHYKTEYYVRAESDCPTHGTHALTGTATDKRHIESLIKEVVDDLPFYNDHCSLREVRGIYTGSKKFYRTSSNERREDPLVQEEKTYITKKQHKGGGADVHNRL